MTVRPAPGFGGSFEPMMPASHRADGFGVRSNVIRSTATMPPFGAYPNVR